MKRTNNILCVLLFGSILFSCQKNINFEEAMIDPKMTVNSFISNDGLVKVAVTRNQSINNFNPFEQVSNAKVVLLEEGSKVEELSYQKELFKNPYSYLEGQPEMDTAYYYTSTIKTQFGKKYKVEVTHPDEEKTISGETFIPRPVQITSIDTSTVFQKRGNFTEIQLFFKLRFSDPGNEANFYRITLKFHNGYKTYTVENGDTVNFIRTEQYERGTHLSDYDPVLSSDTKDANSLLFGAVENTYNVFTDEIINGKNNEITFAVGFASHDEIPKLVDEEAGEFTHTTIQLHSISPDEYYYLSSIDNQFYNDELPFVEPVPIYSNIENGNGIFAGYSVSEMEFNIGKYPVTGIQYDIDRK